MYLPSGFSFVFTCSPKKNEAKGKKKVDRNKMFQKTNGKTAAGRWQRTQFPSSWKKNKKKNKKQKKNSVTHPRNRSRTSISLVSCTVIGSYRLLLGFTGFYWVLLGFTGFCLRYNLGFSGFEITGFYWVCIRSHSVFSWFEMAGFYWVWNDWVLLGFPLVLLSFTGIYWVILVFTWFYWVSLSFHWFSWVSMGFTGLYWVLLGFY